jgi:hypothetical protein
LFKKKSDCGKVISFVGIDDVVVEVLSSHDRILSGFNIVNISDSGFRVNRSFLLTQQPESVYTILTEPTENGTWAMVNF